MSRLHPPRRTIALAAAVIVLVDVLVLAVGSLPRSPAVAATAEHTLAPPQALSTPAVAVADVSVAPLDHRYRADLMITGPRPLRRADLRVVRTTVRPVALETVDAARIRLGRGRTTALGVSPSSFRAFTPRGTAGVDPLWAAVARGDAAVAHAVARALRVELGGSVRAGRGPSVLLRVGAFATSGLPGVGVLAPRSRSDALGLVRRSAAVVSLAHAADAPAAGRTLRDRLPDAFRVRTVQSFVQVRKRAAWVAPAAGLVTSRFGPRPYPLDPSRRDFHPGIDIAAPFGAPVWAAASGTVLYAGPAAGFGNEIILLHANGVTTVYGHMSRLLVDTGVVRAGQPIALVGSEGDSTGPHLHFEVHRGDERVDPLSWLQAHGVAFHS